MVKITEINEQNPWWSQGKDFTKFDKNLSQAEPLFFQRKAIKAEKGSIHILRGPRQVGKTTYLKGHAGKLMEKGVPSRDILYLSLDFFVSRRELRNAIRYFLDSRRDAAQVYLLLDEITALPDWNLELKYMADQGVLKRGAIIATGSSAVKLKEKGELLPGRGLEGNEHYIKPLSFREFAIQSIGFISKSVPRDDFRHALIRLKSALSSCCIDLDSGIDEIGQKIEKILPFKEGLYYLFGLYLITGGLPLVINDYFSNRYLHQKEIITSAIAEIFVRDVLGDMARLQRQETITRQLLRAIVERYGSRYSFSKLSREMEKSHVTTIDYLQFMEDSFICFVLYAYDFNKKDIKAKGDKKVCFFDPFIYHSTAGYLGGKNVWDVILNSLENEDIMGKLIEGIVVSHLRMHGEVPLMKSGNTFLWFYYDKGGREVDAVYESESGYSGLEVKFRGGVDERDMKRISPLKKYLLLSKEDVWSGAKMMIVPVDIFLALLPVSKNNL